jgi:hypothetical protein
MDTVVVEVVVVLVESNGPTDRGDGVVYWRVWYSVRQQHLPLVTAVCAACTGGSTRQVVVTMLCVGRFHRLWSRSSYHVPVESSSTTSAKDCYNRFDSTTLTPRCIVSRSLKHQHYRWCLSIMELQQMVVSCFVLLFQTQQKAPPPTAHKTKK